MSVCVGRGHQQEETEEQTAHGSLLKVWILSAPLGRLLPASLSNCSQQQEAFKLFRTNLHPLSLYQAAFETQNDIKLNQ